MGRRKKQVSETPEMHALLNELSKYGITELNKALRYARFHKPDVYENFIKSQTEFMTTDQVETEVFPTGIQCLDRVIGGGIKLGASYEFFGQYGSGKTQISLAIAKSMIERGFKVAYLYTEGHPPVARIKSMIHSNQQNFLFTQVRGVEHFRVLVKSPQAISSDVLIVDSITGLFRRVFQSTDNIAEYKKFERLILQDLFAYIDTDGVVIFTNQVYGSPQPFQKYVAFGGHVLYHFSTYRINVKRHDVKKGEMIVTLYAEDCPDVPPIECNVVITDEGVKDA